MSWKKGHDVSTLKKCPFFQLIEYETKCKNSFVCIGDGIMFKYDRQSKIWIFQGDSYICKKDDVWLRETTTSLSYLYLSNNVIF